jgi:DNA-binding beta-propeller fold protein YncE
MIGLLVVVCVCLLSPSVEGATLKSPVLAITYHKGADSLGAANAFLYSGVDGTPVGGSNSNPEHLVGKGRADKLSLNGLRSMLNLGGGNVLLVNSHKSNSSIVLYQGLCNADGTIPNHDGNLTIFTNDNVLSHPYDITRIADGSGYYISNQDTNTIVRLDANARSANIVLTLSGPRGMALDGQGRLWVCEDTTNTLSAYDTNRNYTKVLSFPLTSPIAIRYDAARKVMVVTNNDKKSSRVSVYNAVTGAEVTHIEHSSFDHGSGLATNSGAWYALSRNTNTLFLVDIDGGTMTSLNSNLMKEPEQMEFLTC